MNSLLVVCIRFTTTDLRKKIKFSHHTQYGFQIHIFVMLSLNPTAHTATTIGLFATLLAVYDEVDYPLIFWLSALSVAPSVVTAARYFKYAAHSCHIVFTSESFDNTIFQFHLLPASDRKFRSNSTCIRNSVISLLRRVSSSAGFLRGRPLGSGMYPAAMSRVL